MNSAQTPQGRLTGVPTLLTAEEAATILRVRPSWLERQAAKRKIPFSMLGGCYRFTADHLMQIVAIFEASPDQPSEETPVRTRRTKAPRQALPKPSNVTPLRARPRRQTNSHNAAA
ncbi:helix-turn-helix domain-containing protein [Paractinoplanes rishiriensis]|uniref:helix-turn-helix domain-containing protein n=1 Tax=Paractinoplanes rishiriensis TaxID=1050105 RepID=UPI0034DB11AB